MPSRTTAEEDTAPPPATTLVQTALLENAVKEMRILRRSGRSRNAKAFDCGKLTL